MKAKPLKLVSGEGWVPCSVEEAGYVQLNMPGPLPTRIIPVILKGTRAGTGCWSWNGDTEKPTLRPSILSRATKLTPLGEKQYQDWRDAGMSKQPEGFKFDSVPVACHTFVNDGKAQFLSDCSHELANQTLDLLDVE